LPVTPRGGISFGRMGPFTHKHIALGVTGSIAAYKALPLLRLLQAGGAQITPLLTPQAQHFVGQASFAALCGTPCVTDPWDLAQGGHIGHVELAQRANLLLVAPATAQALAAYAHGFAGDPISCLWLSSRAPKVVAPAMETAMWESPATVENLASLRARGVHVVEPQSGELASGAHGLGRLAALEAIVETAQRALQQDASLEGATVVVTAGPTREAFDPARFLSNPASGRMGLALARAAWRRGAKVHLVCGPTELPMPAVLAPECIHRVVTHAEMQRACARYAPDSDLLLMAAAPCDLAPVAPKTTKQPKSDPQFLVPQLQRTADILAELTCAPHRCFVVGFAAQTTDDLGPAQAKLKRKNLDLVVHNRIDRPNSGFAFPTNEATLVPRHGEPVPLGPLSKDALAERILDAVAEARAT
jgi:phosphopantothenoylcysteine decarboxylase/phosphopantothenate--cysteine ligase